MSHHEINYEQRIREQGYRLTPQREIIMDALCAIGDHATANEVYERVQGQTAVIDRATVYRTLHFFHELGLVSASTIDGDTRYEIAGPRPHHHLICRACGGELTLDDGALDALAAQLQRAHGFAAEFDHLVISGLCRACQAAPKERVTP